MTITARCGRTTNSKGKAFTEKTLRKHQYDCLICTPRAKCGRTHSQQGLRFDTPKRLADHEAQCPHCRRGIPYSPDHGDDDGETYESLGLGMTEMIAGDESDGVFWGIAHELGEW